MHCFHPITVRGPDYSGPVPCGKCFACQSNRRRDWHMRIKYEMLHSLQSYTVTLTYDDQHIPAKEYFVDYDPVQYPDRHGFWYHPLDIDHVQRFFKRLRKDGYKFRYFGVGEYGGKTARPHYHIIFFFNEFVDITRFTKEVHKHWLYGIQITIDKTNDDCIGYTLKYCLKMYNVFQPSPKLFCSKRPFIGNGYLQPDTVSYLRSHPGDVVPTISGTMRIPRIIRNKIYDDNMLAINKEILQDKIVDITDKKAREASDRGLSLGELQELERKSFTKKCIKAIMKKTL